MKIALEEHVSNSSAKKAGTGDAELIVITEFFISSAFL